MCSRPASLSVLALAGLTAAAPVPAPIAGRWVTDDGKAIVAIAPCGKAMCGVIARVLAPTPKGPPADENNPDPALRRRPILGLPVLTGFTANGDGWTGRIYDPEGGRTYRSVLRRTGPDRIAVKAAS